MSTQVFDPYAKWLGIPKHQRPPTHYQLLGIAPDEPDPEVIEEAAIRQSAHVRTYQSGQHAKECARILNEIALARVTLLDAGKRKASAATLPKLEPVAAHKSAPTPAKDEATLPIFDVPPPMVRKRSSGNGAKIAIMASIGAVAVGGIIAAVLIFSGGASSGADKGQAKSLNEKKDNDLSFAAANPSTPKNPVGSTPIDPPRLATSPSPPSGDPARPATPSPRPRDSIPGMSKADPPVRPPVIQPSRTRERKYLPGELYLLTLNGPCKLDLATGKVGLLQSLDLPGPHSFAFYGPDTMFVAANSFRSPGQLGVFQDGQRTRVVPDILQPNAKNRRPSLGLMGVDAQGAIYMPRYRDAGLTRITPDGSVVNVPSTNDALMWGEPIAVSAKGEVFVTAWIMNQANVIRLFRVDTITGQLTELLQLAEGPVSGLAVDNGGNLYLCHKDEILRLPARSKAPQTLATIPRAYRVTLGPDGSLYALTNDNRPSLWRIDLKSGDAKSVADMLPHATDFAFVPSSAAEVAAAPAANKLPAPDADAQAKAEKDIKDLFKAEYAKKKSADLLALANTLLKQAQTTLDDNTARYVLYREAQDLAVQAGDLNLAWNIIASWAEEFEIDGPAAKLKALTAVAKLPSVLGNPQALQELVQEALHWTVEVRAADDIELALGILAILETASKKLSSSDATAKAVQTVLKDTKDRQKEFEEAQAAKATLEKDPDDAKANLTFGRYTCLVKGDWNNGLGNLAKGSDPKLKALAEMELAAPSDPMAQAALADAWWDYANKDAVRNKNAALRRSGYWYREAFPQLGGLAKTKAEQRLAQIPEPSEIPGLGPIRRTLQVPARLYLDPNVLSRDANTGIRVQAGQTLILRTSGSWSISSSGMARDARGLLAVAIGENGKRPFVRSILNNNQFELRVDQPGYLFLGIAITPNKFFSGALTVQIEVKTDKK